MNQDSNWDMDNLNIGLAGLTGSTEPTKGRDYLSTVSQKGLQGFCAINNRNQKSMIKQKINFISFLG